MNNYEPAPEELKLMMQKCTSVLSASKQYNIPRKLLTNKGYEVLHVQEKDYYLNKEKTIEKCLTFLNQ